MANTPSPLLDIRSVRLLKLISLRFDSFQGQGSLDSSTLRLQMETFPLDADDIKCTDSRVPGYAALSYTWGPAMTPDDSIINPEARDSDTTKVQMGITTSSVDGVHISWVPYYVTKSLRDALLRLWLSGFRRRWLWVDAICINQADSSEKAAQVNMMGEIYSRADSVIVWLGPCEDEMKDWMWLHIEFLDALEASIEQSGVEGVQAEGPYQPKFLKYVTSLPPCGNFEDCWAKYMSFSRRRRWFSRAWIVQEIVNAKSIIVQCGTLLLSWERIERLALIINAHGWPSLLGMDISAFAGRAIADGVMRLVTMRWNRRRLIPDHSLSLWAVFATARQTQPDTRGVTDATQYWTSLQSLLFDTRQFLATDPRDKVFSILSMAELGSKGVQERCFDVIRPEYSVTISPQSVFTKVTVSLLQELPRLTNLSYVEDKSNIILPGLPSWVPDYTCTTIPMPPIQLRDSATTFDCCSNLGKKSKIDHHVGVRYTESMDTLAVKARKIDRIVEVCTPMWDIFKAHDISSCLIILSNLPQTYATGQSRGEVLWRTMIADTASGLPATTKTEESFRIYALLRLARKVSLEAFQAIPKVIIMPAIPSLPSKSTINAHVSPFMDLFRSLEGVKELPAWDEVIALAQHMLHFRIMDFVKASDRQDPDHPFLKTERYLNGVEVGAREFKDALGMSSGYRRLFRTEKGFLGLGPQSSEVGDEVWLLETAKVPFVLHRRKDESEYELVGETYLHGAMHGELTDKEMDKSRWIYLV